MKFILNIEGTIASIKAQDISEPEYCLLLCTYVIYYMHIVQGQG